MIFTTANGRSYDTDKDLSAPERHVLQKLFLWESMVSTVQEFRDRTQDALVKGWNRSGPIQGCAAFRAIVKDLEAKVSRRLEFKTNSGNA